jgi:transposase
MTKKPTVLTLLLGLTLLTSCGQNSKYNPANKFLDFLNNYQVDSLQTLVADNFQLKRTYNPVTSDKKSFIEKYIPNSKNFKGKFKILKTTTKEQATQFIVEDQSDYMKYLHIDYPKWKIEIIATEQNKIASMTIDTTKNYQSYLKQVKEKGGEFENWLKFKYPNETHDTLYATEGLLIKRLKEFSNK